MYQFVLWLLLQQCLRRFGLGRREQEATSDQKYHNRRGGLQETPAWQGLLVHRDAAVPKRESQVLAEVGLLQLPCSIRQPNTSKPTQAAFVNKCPNMIQSWAPSFSF